MKRFWSQNIFGTWFKECLLESVPGLYESRKGRNILLSLDGDVGKALFDACENSCSENSLALARAAWIIRSELFAASSIDGDVSIEKQNDSVPFCLQQFMELLIEGCPSKSHVTKSVANNIGQLIKFNSVKTQRRKLDASTRHCRQLETPLPVAMGLYLHNSTRQRKLSHIKELMILRVK